VVDSDSDFEQVAQEEEQNAGVAESEIDGKVPATAHASVEEQGSGGGGAARHGDGNYFYSRTIFFLDSLHG
jgi:hypothetical protein